MNNELNIDVNLGYKNNHIILEILIDTEICDYIQHKSQFNIMLNSFNQEQEKHIFINNMNQWDIIKNSVSTIDNDVEFKRNLNKVFDFIPYEYVDVIKYRYGFEDGRYKTIDAVCKKFNITRERVRVIISNTFRSIITNN